MSLPIHTFGTSVHLTAEQTVLTLSCQLAAVDWTRRETWPKDALEVSGGWRTALEVEQILEAGLAEVVSGDVQIAYDSIREIENDLQARVTSEWTHPNPFLLKIDRKSDVGRPDFRYKYQFLLAGRPVHLERCGYYVRRTGDCQIYRLDTQMHSLVEAMDVFNDLPVDRKTLQESWLTFAKVKGCAKEVGASLDSTLQKNDVVVPSSIGLDLFEHEDGSLSFLPHCPELATEEFQQLFERNPGAEKVYSLDRPGLGRVRVVLSDTQHEVLRRMKRVRRVRGELKESLKRNPIQVFDGIAADLELSYSDRVTGIGDFKFAPIPRSKLEGAAMGGLWDSQRQFEARSEGTEIEPTDSTLTTAEGFRATDGALNDSDETCRQSDVPDAASGLTRPELNADFETERPGHLTKKVLLIETNQDTVKDLFLSQAEKARQLASPKPFQRPQALRESRTLYPHQEVGVQWLQNCLETPGRQGVLLADDMGVGKTIQILTFLAWCIESGKFPDLSRPIPPFRPILIVVPLILLDTRNWQNEMDQFFENDGSVFWPVLALHGSQLADFRRDGSGAPELQLGQPILDLNRIQRNRVVITNYETLKNYQHSFAHFKEGKSLWSVIVGDEAQEFKTPSTGISHAFKALKSEFQIACTGTPVENRLLDLWNICDAIQPGLLSSAREFKEQFEDRIDADIRGLALDELKKKLLFQQPHAFLLRRNKSEVANLPSKHIVKVQCDMSEMEVGLHQQILDDMKAEKDPSRFLMVLQRFAHLYQHPALLTGSGEEEDPQTLIAQSSKLQSVIKQLHTIRVRREKAIIFARHRVMQRILAKVLQQEFRLPLRIINGDTKMKRNSSSFAGAKSRSEILDEFRTKSGFDILILSPFVAGIGLTIVEANHVFHYGRWWNPAVESQATDRVYRIGQTKEVFVYIPILHDPSARIVSTFDERLDTLMERKYRLAEDFLRPLTDETALGVELLGALRNEKIGISAA